MHRGQVSVKNTATAAADCGYERTHAIAARAANFTDPRSVRLTTRADVCVRACVSACVYAHRVHISHHPLSSLIMGFDQVKHLVCFFPTKTLLSSKYFWRESRHANQCSKLFLGLFVARPRWNAVVSKNDIITTAGVRRGRCWGSVPIANTQVQQQFVVFTSTVGSKDSAPK